METFCPRCDSKLSLNSSNPLPLSECSSCNSIFNPFQPGKMACINCSIPLYFPPMSEIINCPNCNAFAIAVETKMAENQFKRNVFNAVETISTNGFMKFCKERRPEITSKNEGKSFGEITFLIRTEWDALNAENKSNYF